MDELADIDRQMRQLSAQQRELVKKAEEMTRRSQMDEHSQDADNKERLASLLRELLKQK